MFLISCDLSGNEGQCFLYEGCKLIAFHMSLQCLITQAKYNVTKPPKFLASIKCFFIFLFLLAFSQMTLDLHITNRMKLRAKFCFLKNETFLS